MIDRATVTMRELVGEGEKRGRNYLTFGIWSYLTVGLLFGLTLPGVSAHGFLRGGGWGKGLYSSKPYKSFSERDKIDRRRKMEDEERESPKWTERKKTTGRSGRSETIQRD